MKASEVLTRDELHALTRRSDAHGLLAVLGTWAGIAAIFAGAAAVPHPLTWLAAAVLLGGRQHALAVLMHEAAHGMLCRRRWLNDAIGHWLCGVPIWVDFSRYRRHHIGHHAHTGTAEDPDLSLTLPFPCTRKALARKLARDVTGISGIRRIAAQLLMDCEFLEYSASSPSVWRRHPRLRQHLLAGARRLAPVLAVNAGLLALLWTTGHPWLFAAWGLAYLTWLNLFLRVRAIAEHAGMAASPDIAENTRTTHASGLARLFIAPHNVQYHLEHHLVPTMPMRFLPRAHRLLRDRGVLPDASVGASHLQVLARVSAGR